jgi:hypothetical protein
MDEVLGVVHRRVRERTETMTQKGPFLIRPSGGNNSQSLIGGGSALASYDFNPRTATATLK